MTAPPLRLGILGAARIAPKALVHPAREVDGVAVRAVAARDSARARSFAAKHGIPVVHDGYA
ncbi:MAG: gfo/Idh/MocA family oxidoreductase, partial [Myxococcota bacterium]